MLTYGSLFSGIGGIDLGLDRAGMQCKWQVEIDDYATKVLAKHWPDVARFRDIRNCGANNLTSVDLICGGFPCQDISVAGKRAGIDGERSGLWREFYRIICELRPRFVIIENVPALLSGGEWIEQERDKCICGWPYRWRRLHHHRKIHKQERQHILSPYRRGHVSKSNWHSGMVENQLWRQHSTVSQGYNGMGTSLLLDGNGQTSTPILANSSALSHLESRTSPFSDTTARDGSGIVTLKGMDGGSQEERQDYLSQSAGTQPQRAWEQRYRDGWMVCPSCGRDMGNAADGHVFRSWMGVILGDLAASGYDAEWQVLSAAQFGAQHLRRRVFIVAYPQRPSSWLEKHRGSRQERQSTGTSQPTFLRQENGSACTARIRADSENVADASSTRLEIAGQHRRIPTTKSKGASTIFERRGSPSIQQLDYWAVEPSVCRMVDGFPYRVDRIRGLGNAVVPQIAEYIGNCIMNYHQHNVSLVESVG